MRHAVLLLVPFLLFGCKKEEEGPDTTLRNAYFEALCRFYSDTTCVDNQIDSCGGAISFDTNDECQQFFRFAAAGCTGYVEALNDNQSTVQGCIDQLDAFNCGTEDICDGEDSILEAGDCGAVDVVMEDVCPEDTSL